MIMMPKMKYDDAIKSHDDHDDDDDGKPNENHDKEYGDESQPKGFPQHSLLKGNLIFIKIYDDNDDDDDDDDDDNMTQSDDHVQYLDTKPTASVCTRPSKYLQIFANEIKIDFDLVGFDLLGQWSNLHYQGQWKGKQILFEKYPNMYIFGALIRF